MVAKEQQEQEEAQSPAGAGGSVLHVCLARAAQLERRLQEVQRSLEARGGAGPEAMQENVEQRLLACQEMLLEIEQKVASVASLSPAAGSALAPVGSVESGSGPGPGPGLVGSQRQAAELLSSKLELLKSHLVSFQQLLQDRQDMERTSVPGRLQQAEPGPPESRRRRSVQELLSSPCSSHRNALSRQGSLQQQKELEQELSEQRGLTRAIARQGSAGGLHESEELSRPSPRWPPAEAWAGLRAGLLALEESWRPPSRTQVTDSSARRRDGTAGRGMGSEKLKELGTLISHVRELRAAPAHDQTQDLLLFNVLHEASVLLSSLRDLLDSPAEATPDGDLQADLLQRVSAELATLDSELARQGSEVAPGSEGGQRCVEVLRRVVPVVQAAASLREEQLRSLQEAAQEHRRRLRLLHAAFAPNQSTVNQITCDPSGALGPGDRLQALMQTQDSLQQQVEEVNSLLQEAEPNYLRASLLQLQEDLGTCQTVVSSSCEELRSSEEEQPWERLLLGLQELASAAPRRLTQPDPQSAAQLRQQLRSRSQFLHFLLRRLDALRFLSGSLAPGVLQRWEGALAALQEEVARLQQLELEAGPRMQQSLELWSQWEDDSAWADSLLRYVETSFPKVHQEGDGELLCGQQGAGQILEENHARFSWMLEAGLQLQRAAGAGGHAVAMATRELEARWRVAQQRVDSERTAVTRGKELTNRFNREIASLTEWMNGARDLVQTWTQVSDHKDTDAKDARDNFLQCVALTQELEARRELKVSSMAAGSQLVLLREEGELLGLDPEDQEVSIDSRLRWAELEWSALLDRVPVAQKALHKRWMETTTRQEAATELQVWLESAESQLELERAGINQTSPSDAELTRLLKYCKECQVATSLHQATLDHVSRPLQTCSSHDDHTGRHRLNRLAEEQGRLQRRWRRLQEALGSQIREAELDLRGRAEREARLRRVNSWMADRRTWIHWAQTPGSRTELERSVAACQSLEEKIGQESAALQELRTNGDFPSGTDAAIQACAALAQQNEGLKRRLTRTRQLWDAASGRQSEAALRTARTTQTLECLRRPRLCLRAHADLHQGLQSLHQETEAAEAEWEELKGDVSALRDMVSPAAAVLLSERLDGQRHSWTQASSAVHQELQRSLGILRRWEVYAPLASSLSQRLQALQRDAASALSGTSGAGDDSAERASLGIHEVQVVLERTEALTQSHLEVALEASRALSELLEPSAAALVQSESRTLWRAALQLSRTLSQKLARRQEDLQLLQEFDDALDSVEENLQDWEKRLEDVGQMGDQSRLLEPSGPSADLDVLNELSCTLTLGDAAAGHLRRLNRRRNAVAARAEEACSQLQTESLRQQSFQQKCESWMSFLQRMEDALAVDVSGSYLGLRQQLCAHKRFQAELSSAHQILHSVIGDALFLLQRGDVDDRSDFLLKLSRLREQWQGAVQRAEARRSLVDALLRHWHLYRRGLRRLQGFLAEGRDLLPHAGTSRCGVRQLRRSLGELRHTELLFQRFHSGFVHTLELGRRLHSMGDSETQARLQGELGSLQEGWDELQGMLGRRKELAAAVVQSWERCQSGLSDSGRRLKDIKARADQSVPEGDEGQFNQESEDSLVDWARSLEELSAMKTDLSQYVMAEDVLLLQEQLEHLHGQWEELCLQVSLRKQEIADRLNAWTLFNDKNRELCEWLEQMESKVAHDSELNLEEMVEKLKKDCMEEMNLFGENKAHLKQLGQQLITASNKTMEAEVNDKVNDKVGDVHQRWQHLFHHIEARVRKLKETLATVQQLDKNMGSLRTWLSGVEAELAAPLDYGVCHGDEIQRKLARQQDLQRDIERHADAVTSVLTLCDVLLHDADAAAADPEDDSVRQTGRSLERRWRNICAASTERRLRIEETSRLWTKFLDDFSRFEDWLKAAEVTASQPESSDVLYTSAKEELKKFEAFQRQVHERLTQLELVNSQYRRLARENRTDAAGRLEAMVQEGNRRWDVLRRRAAAVLRRLKHFTSQREDFEGTREGILVWLTEMDLQLTNVEHFSESDVDDKMRQLDGFQQQITLNTDRIDALIVFGEVLIQKSSPLDAVLMEDELEELHCYCQEVFGRVARFHHRLIHRRPVLEDERDLSDLDDPHDLSSRAPWSDANNEEDAALASAAGGASAGRQVTCHLLAPPPERSGRETPASVDSIPLEWDHTVDVGGSSSHEDDEDASYFSALSVKSASEPPSWHQPGSPESPRPTGSFHQQGYVKLMSECSGSIDGAKRAQLILDDQGAELQGAGLPGGVSGKHCGAGVIQRWELLQAQELSSSNSCDVHQDPERWQKVNSDLCDVTSWLDRTLPELERLEGAAPAAGVRDIEANVRQLKEMQKSFTSYKCLMISVNLNSSHFLRGAGGGDGDADALREALTRANAGWTQACAALERLEAGLHAALMQSQDFHQALRSLLLWLAEAEKMLSGAAATEVAAPHAVLLRQRDALAELQEALLARQRHASSLQDIASHLLLEATAPDSVEAKEKVHVVGNKLRLLLRQAAAQLHSLQSRLDTLPSGSEVHTCGLATLQGDARPQEAAEAQRAAKRTRRRRDSSPQRTFFQRVLRAAFPLHLLLLLLLLCACLVPLSEGDYGCGSANNFARSFYPMLRYTNGPPPT